MEKSALRGLNKGISQSLVNLNDDIGAAIEQFKTQRATQLKNLNALLILCDEMTSEKINLELNGTLERMLVAE